MHSKFFILNVVRPSFFFFFSFDNHIHLHIFTNIFACFCAYFYTLFTYINFLQYEFLRILNKLVSFTWWVFCMFFISSLWGFPLSTKFKHKDVHNITFYQLWPVLIQKFDFMYFYEFVRFSTPSCINFFKISWMLILLLFCDYIFIFTIISYSRKRYFLENNFKVV